jgi:multicomponent K+:H+ antiporter subunit G
MTQVIEASVALFILIGALFLFVGSFGLARLPDTMRRLHAPTKATTLGVGSLLIASMLFFVALRDGTGVHELLITLFLFLTAPVTASMIAKAHLFRSRQVRQDLPAAPGELDWATLETPTGSGPQGDG